MLKFFTLASGSSGNSVYVGTKKTRFLVDAGISGKDITNRLRENGIEANELDGVLVTHEHKDHIKGVGVISRRYNLPIYATPGTWEGMEKDIGKVAEENKKFLDLNQSQELGDLKIEVLPTSHDALEPAAFAFYHKEASLGIVTDTGKITSSIRKNITGCKGLLLEANHDATMLRKGTYPVRLKKRIASTLGHLSNQMSGEALAEFITGNTQKVVLAHLSAENNRPPLAIHTVKEVLAEQGFTSCPELTVAPRYEAHPALQLKAE
ncbi:MBL fold metallo-hydrolase [Bacillota bacterium LX-D]|nr:MBL fold metallo-hydrolase [Bacillota bacterium LX-D]